MNSRKAIDDGIYDNARNRTESLPKSPKIDLEESIKNSVPKVHHLLQK